MAKRASRAPRRTREPRNVGSRPLWTGQLRLSLVSVPVRLYPAVRSGARLAFHQVHASSGKRIRYEKVVPGIGPVDTDEILKGYEISKGHYVLLEQDEIEKAKVEARSTCELVQFVDQCEVDPLYFDKPYYLTPSDELGEEPYRVIRDALRQSRKMALGQIVLRGREYVVSIKPCGEGLLLETLRYANEVRRAAPFFADIGKQKSAKELLELAEELIKRKTAPFDAEAFHDRYSETLRHLIERKAKTKKPIAVAEDEKPQRGAEVIDLVQALKQSIGRGERAKPKAGKRKRAA
jgi:DNA end-binding protein Ku